VDQDQTFLEDKGIRGSMRMEVWEPAGFNLSNAKRLRFWSTAIVRSSFSLVVLRLLFAFCNTWFGQYISPAGRRQKRAFENCDLISQWRFWHPRNCRIITNIQ
jgi:hypothetical protein